jgi:ribosomal protein S18 acetylase RimI-like enzyme
LARSARPTVRAAGPADAPAVAELLVEFNGEGLSPEALARRMEEVQGLETAFLGDWEGEAAGLLVLRIAPTLSGADDWAEIAEMYVRPQFRRRGIGRALVEAALACGRNRGCREFHLLVDPSNEAGQAFYAKLGFQVDSWEMRRDG